MRPRKEILRKGSDIIRFLASKSLSFTLFGVPGLKRIFISIFALVAASVTICCGYKNNPATTTQKPSGFTFRVFISNPLFPTGGGAIGTNVPVLNILDALHDVLSTSLVSLSGDSTQPGLMALSPNLKFTLVYSPAGNTVTAVDNATEAVATASGSTSTLPPFALPGSTESIVVSPFNTTAFAAVPTAPVSGESPGAVEVLNLQSG